MEGQHHEVNYLENLIAGKSYAEAKNLLELGEYTIRIARKDGQDYMLTMDMQKNRVNVELEGEIVKSVIFIG